MEVLCARLAPTPKRGGSVPITPWIDARLHEGDTEGYRIEGDPPVASAALGARASMRRAEEWAPETQAVDSAARQWPVEAKIPQSTRTPVKVPGRRTDLRRPGSIEGSPRSCITMTGIGWSNVFGQHGPADRRRSMRRDAAPGFARLAAEPRPGIGLRMRSDTASPGLGQPSYLDGQLLVAMPTMGDSRFNRSVIYLCAHSQDGAMGIVINQRAKKVNFTDLLVQLDVIASEDAIRLPCAPADAAERM